MSELNSETITTLMSQFDTSTAQVLDLKTDQFTLHLNKNVDMASDTTASAKPVIADQVAKAVTTEQPKIKAPLVGVAYLAASPDKPAFVSVGDHVKAGETVCVIEAMKLINDVPSPVSGTITKILVSDATMVEYDEPLFEIEVD
ncbi:acetyl-CoA carboxylase biotin carboxyl carrier protein [Lactiplantibacillus mudanjiangensis]|uniref:Biotin carboxyl carrier protein of acetyl-CoA carboxylase n=1 Tax=Lactiplantibacillus mudanjiangensis TaxID=1296538 RepID=A0A660E430_9LACO|nr:acetyl-CoA carboxylase biotin carboxyl carrier protein subunit [Lactiplantibacillus mudanjiangensis]VDG20679.1 acetyl-CoA carboxylase, biotin carboxyl carrier protein [Lactobacillus plantarum JDM1] [Lactiplantibacillus mudanjiangensis]VDG24177.1 acetyl-CoA carboxylase, biotin carboxyl carrier protein [Lactobacillus plantarum JDM1] [Lactiplantibacillus mudanjiangensis]VDG30158.1 acetyl-CoA carboxylase, biotin carboxyl carrier protein [Lactobacillus plantarum JDM1] [Lactiplantibacillus mudanjia